MSYGRLLVFQNNAAIGLRPRLSLASTSIDLALSARNLVNLPNVEFGEVIIVYSFKSILYMYILHTYDELSELVICVETGVV